MNVSGDYSFLFLPSSLRPSINKSDLIDNQSFIGCGNLGYARRPKLPWIEVKRKYLISRELTT